MDVDRNRSLKVIERHVILSVTVSSLVLFETGSLCS